MVTSNSMCYSKPVRLNSGWPVTTFSSLPNNGLSDRSRGPDSPLLGPSDTCETMVIDYKKSVRVCCRWYLLFFYPRGHLASHYRRLPADGALLLL